MQKQQGMTFIGTLFTVGVIVIASIITMSVVPVYLQYYSLVASIKGLNTIPQSSLTGDPFQDVQFLKSSLDKRLDINGIDSLKDNQLTIQPHGDFKYTVKLKYQVIRPLISNVSLLFDFNRTDEVVAGSEN